MLDNTTLLCYSSDMKQNTTQLKVTRDGQVDNSYLIAVKRQQAKRYAGLLVKTALRASGTLVLRMYTRVYDDINQTNDYEAIFGKAETPIERHERLRNEYGQFVQA